jgi:2-polyprenyl-6-methoxyphenol hydroxylase-like FAD-dependent oxidoreductase
MFSRKKPEVLVVGAGPVGLFTALALTARNIPVQIVEKGWRTGMRSYALALHAESLRLFEPIGLFGPVLERSRRVRRIGLYEGSTRRAEMRVSEVGEDHSFLAILPQDALEELMVEELQRRGVKVTWNHEVGTLTQDQDGVDVTLHKLSQDSVGYSVQHTEWVVSKSSRARFPYVIGADGHASVVRRALDIDFPSVGPTSEFAVFEFLTDADLGDEMRLGLEERSTNVCWPLPGKACRFSFERTEENVDWDTREKDREVVQIDSALFPTLDEDRLRRLLGTRAPWFTGSVEGIRWRMKVRFEQRLASALGRGRAWLVGDAVHLTGPVGIQSMNVGFREALRLVDAIEHGLSGMAANEAFAGYEQDCLREWRQLLGQQELLQAQPDTPPWVAARLGRLVPCIPASGQGLGRLAAQMGLRTVVPDGGAVAKPAAGKQQATREP